MDLTGISSVVGGAAAVGALLWAMVGNPNVLGIRRTATRILPGTPRIKRTVVDVDWKDLEKAVDLFKSTNSSVYDLVVGIQPDGMSLASLLGARLHCRCLIADKHYSSTSRNAFFVFDQDKQSRSVRPSVTEFSPPANLTPTKVLIVDGVTTFGNALLKAEGAVRSRFVGVDIDFFVFAMDEARLAAAHPELLSRLSSCKKIDNHRTWLRFPWDAN